MPKLKITDDDLDVEELENAEVNERDYEPYEGPEPPKGTILAGYVKRLYWTYTQNDDPMLKVLFIASDNTGTKAKFNGWASWDNIAITAPAKFRWKPFLDAYGLTIRDVKTKTMVEADAEGNMGDPIISIAKWKPGEEQDGAWARIVVKVERGEYAGSKIDTWLEYAEPEDADEEDPEDEEEPEDETEDETEDEEPEDGEDEEEEDEPATPKRGAVRRTSTPAPARGAKAGSAKPARAAATARSKPAATATRRSTAKPAATTRATARATRGRSKAGKDDDPPF